MTIARKLDPLLEAVIPAVRRAERFLGPEDDWVEDDRRILYEAAQRHLGHLHTFLREKGMAEYVTTVHADDDAVERAIYEAGYQRNLTSTRKYRTHHDGGKQWACGAFVLDGLEGDHGYIEQHHVYLFEAPNGATDVYAHRETSVLEGAEHLTDTHQEHGAPHELFDIFDRAGFEYGRRETLK
jgi:hypothetical protein